MTRPLTSATDAARPPSPAPSLPQVCFAIFMPTLLYTFLYSFPASGNILIDTGM